MTHFKQVCQYGHVHGQCRCAAPDKQTITIPCPAPPPGDDAAGIKALISRLSKYPRKDGQA